MKNQSDDLDTEEMKVLKEALSDSKLRVGPSEEYAAELRRRLLSVATPARAIRGRPSRRVLLGSILGGSVAAIVLAVVWHLNAEPAWASAIRMAREQAWIHARIERDDVPKGDVWVSPERDIVAARLGKTFLFQDYKHQTFLRYDEGQKVAYRTFQPEDANLARELSSVSSLASMFRRSPGAPALLPDQQIERWSLQSRIVDGLPCDEYEIVFRPPDRAQTTLVLTIDKRRSLPRSLTISEAESHTMISRFDYPAVGVDEQSLGIPPDVQIVDVDKTGELSAIAQPLREGRENFDDYTALSVTSLFDDARPLTSFDVRRVSRKGKKWRIDIVHISDPIVLPKDHDQALNAWHANEDRFHIVPQFICDGRSVRTYDPEGKTVTGERPLTIDDDSAAGGVTLHVPERSCRPSFSVGRFNHIFEVTHEAEGLGEGLIKVEVWPRPMTKGFSDVWKTYWLDPSRGNAAVRIVFHRDGVKATGPNKSSAKLREITFEDFRQSPRGFWYPTVISRDLSVKSKRTTRLYVDFDDVPSDALFGPIHQSP